jgi:putative flippase GtrA
VQLFAQMQKFGVVGLLGYILDVGLFNLLSLSTLELVSEQSDPIVFKAISSFIAICFTFVLNGQWTFARHLSHRSHSWRFVVYLAINLLAMLIVLSCLFVSRFLLGFNSLLADNIAANFVGTALAMVFRFVLYRKVVFPS